MDSEQLKPNFQNIDDSVQKRTKERSVQQAYNSVILWRQYFQNGLISEDGTKFKLNLQEAALKVGIPKKTLEDYSAIFKKLYNHGIDLNLHKDKKMGVLRQILKTIKDHRQTITKYVKPQNQEEQKEIINDYRSISALHLEYDNLVLEDQVFCSPGLYDYINLPDDVKIRQTEIKTQPQTIPFNNSMSDSKKHGRFIVQQQLQEQQKIIFEE